MRPCAADGRLCSRARRRGQRAPAPAQGSSRAPHLVYWAAQRAGQLAGHFGLMQQRGHAAEEGGACRPLQRPAGGTRAGERSGRAASGGGSGHTSGCGSQVKVAAAGWRGTDGPLGARSLAGRAAQQLPVVQRLGHHSVRWPPVESGWCQPAAWEPVRCGGNAGACGRLKCHMGAERGMRQALSELCALQRAIPQHLHTLAISPDPPGALLRTWRPKPSRLPSAAPARLPQH